MQALAVDLQLLRSLLLPDMKIVPGRVLMARVAGADGSGRGTISIAGYLLEAELPKHATAGQELRLVVREVSPERVLLSVARDTQAPAPPPPPPAVALPGGGRLQVLERDPGSSADGSEGGTHSLSLRYDAPSLGAVDLRFELDPSSLRLAVSVSPAALPDATAASDELTAALGEAVGRTAAVTVTARREPLEIYA